MEEKISLALRSAEENYLYYKNSDPSEGSVRSADHIIALNALFESFVHYEFAVAQTTALICSLDEESELFGSLIEPHLRVLDDIELISKEYAKMYIKYIAKIAQGLDSRSAVENLFA